MSIVIFDVEEWEHPALPKSLAGHNLVLVSDKVSSHTAEQAAEAEVISIFSWSTVDKESLAAMPNLKHIATRSTGVDHIDMVECARRGITVSNVPEYGERTVAEHTFALMLALSRKILHCDNRTKLCDFSRDGLRGFDLEGKTIGLIGAGKIGSKVAEIARAFAMKVVVYDKYQDDEKALKLNFKYVKNLDELLSQSDVISLHVPLTPETKHLINTENIKKVKSGALLINTARGDLVQTEAVLKGLESGQLAGAGLDVLENEKLIHDETEVLAAAIPSQEELSSLLHNHILLTNPKVIITPHNAFNSDEAVRRITDTALANIKAYLSGQPENLVEI